MPDTLSISEIQQLGFGGMCLATGIWTWVYFIKYAVAQMNEIMDHVKRSQYKSEEHARTVSTSVSLMLDLLTQAKQEREDHRRDMIDLNKAVREACRYKN